MTMNLATGRKILFTSFSPLLSPSFPPPHQHTFYFPLCPSPSPYCRHSPLIRHAKKKDSLAQPLLKQSTTEQEEELESDGEETEEKDEEEEYIEDYGDELSVEDNGDFEDDFEEGDANLYVGDGGAGGGILLANTWWDKEALSIAEEVLMSFHGDLKIYAFKTSANSNIRVRIEKLSTKYGSPNMTDIGDFSSAYRMRLDEAIVTGRIPENISLEVSSPGVERVVQVPDELERFKEKPMYVRYAISDTAADSPQESDGIFRLISLDLEACHCTWGIADVKANRKQAGKGRPLNKKQREWRLQTPFDSLRLVRIHSDC